MSDGLVNCEFGNSAVMWTAIHFLKCRYRVPPIPPSFSVTGCLHVPIVGPTGRTDCSRTTHICQSNQCGLLADYNTAYAAAWLVVRLASRSDQSDVVSTRFDSRIGSRKKSNIRSSVRPVERSVYTIRSSDRPVGPTGRSDDRNV